MIEPMETLASYNAPHEAELTRLHLVAAGIRAVLQDAGIVGMHGLLANAVGGIKLLVPTPQLEAARELLRSTSAVPAGGCLSCGAAMSEDQDTCASCGWSYAAQE